MPTPSDEEAVSPNVMPMLALDITAPMRGIFPSCPPEEGRGEQQRVIAMEGGEAVDQEVEVARVAEDEEGGVQSRVGGAQSSIGGAQSSIAGMQSSTGGVQSEVVDSESTVSTVPGEMEGKVENEDNTGGQTAIHAEMLEKSPSPAPSLSTSERDRDSDVRLAQSMATATIASSDAAKIQTPSARYLHFPELDRDRQTSYNSTTSFLRPGSKFRGTQQSDRQVYDVQVEVKDVDMAESILCGYLRIQGLTDDHPTLTTFFEGEIIGPKYLFRTDHPSWGSSEKVDMQHWARFPAWRPLAKSALKSPSASSAYLNRFDQREHLFMRWKEYFLVPDHRVKTITGASFEGFYYICFNQCSGTVSGIYFHAKSEKFQQLELRHVEDHGCMPAVEFR